MQEVSVIITDLDNTLYDWFKMWHLSFSRMLSRLVEMSGIKQDILECEIRQVFQHYGTSEYEFLIEELPSLKSLHPGEDLSNVYSSAIKEYRDARIETYHLYPTVFNTLKTLKDSGCLIIGHTESRYCYTIRRLKMLQLDGLLDYVYSPPDHYISDSNRRHQHFEKYRLTYTIVRHTREGEYKPDPRILEEIINNIGVDPEKTVYIGDSLMKDIQMAQSARVSDVFAKYGASQDRDAYELLRRVSHWTQADVEREKQICKAGNVCPKYTLMREFGELLNMFEFVPLKRSY